MTKKRCPLPWQQVVVGISGIIVPCCYRPWPEAFGNLRDDEVSAIWNGPRFTALRRDMVERGVEGACPDCQMIPVQGLPPLMRKPEYLDGETPYARNMAVLEREFAEGASVLEAAPTMFTISPSGICDLACPHCSQRENHVSKESVGDNAWNAIRDLTPRLDYLNWGGGEPTVQPEFRRFLASGLPESSPHLTLAMISNGLTLKPGLIERLCRFHGANIQISIDAGTRETYERVRPPAKWDVLTANLRALAEARKTNPGVWLVGSYTINKGNVADLTAYIRLCRELEMPSSFYMVWHYPPRFRPDLFNDVDAETVGWRDEFARARDAAARFDAEELPTCRDPNGELYAMYPFLDRYLETITTAMDAAATHRPRRFDLGSECADRFALIRRQSDRVEVAYGRCDASGALDVRVPDAPLRIELWETEYLYRRVALAHYDDPWNPADAGRFKLDAPPSGAAP